MATAEPIAAAGPTEMAHDPDSSSDKSYDVHFIDSMVEHHQGVIAMAAQALRESQDIALKDLAQSMMTVAQKEITELTTWRQQWYPDAEPMKDPMNMGSMLISTDTSQPFDERFVAAMVSHHQGSIKMAIEAQAKLGRPELLQFATEMQAEQEAEIAQLQQLAQQ
ncbi:MAG: DUF305 domain-containing protein [Anaerolineae bacterium]